MANKQTKNLYFRNYFFRKKDLTICQIVLLHFCFIFYIAQLNFIIINKSVLIILIKGYNIDNY